ncbi:MAG: hypothetical protein WDZ84_04160 [Rhodovibrionaceae bacterium]
MLESLAVTVKFIFRQRKQGRIESFDQLADFLGSRSAYIAQTSLYGYLKTRMGTQFTRYFEDDEFSRLIHQAALRLYVSCLADFTIHCVALLKERASLSSDDARELANGLFEAALAKGVTERDRVLLPSDAIVEFGQRVSKTVWESELNASHAFQRSVEDVLRFAPVVEEFKVLDTEIVTNSIRFRWRDAREQLRNRLSVEEVVASSFRS